MQNEIKKWFAVDIFVDQKATDAAESALSILDSLGIETDSLNKPNGEPLRVTGYFDQLPEIEFIRAAVARSLEIYGHSVESIIDIATRTVISEDWLAEWKRHWKPTVVGKFLVAPPWESVQENDQIVIKIEPNMAFGTGTHETTRLCLMTISDEIRSTDSFLDVGTGTGILAIAAAKLGCSQIAAYDTDVESVRIARENAELNGVADLIDLCEGPIGYDTKKASFVCANLTLDVILPILQLLLVKCGRLLLLSGILKEQERSIKNALNDLGHNSIRINTEGEWISVLVGVKKVYQLELQPEYRHHP